MYLLLVDNNFVSSREIKKLLDENNIACEVVNCSSSEALIDISEKLTPDIVIIDFDFYIDDSAEIVRRLRRINSNAYILAFIDPDHYEKLRLAIEEGIDDYLVKPLQREDIMLRIKMGLQRKGQEAGETVSGTDHLEQKTDKDTRALFLEIADAFKRKDEVHDIGSQKSEEVQEEEIEAGSAPLSQPDPVLDYDPEIFSPQDEAEIEQIAENDLLDSEPGVEEDFDISPEETGKDFQSEDLFDLEPKPEHVPEGELSDSDLSAKQTGSALFDEFDLEEGASFGGEVKEELPELTDADFQLFGLDKPESSQPEKSRLKEDRLESLEELFQDPVDHKLDPPPEPQMKSFTAEADSASPEVKMETEPSKPKSIKIDDSELFGTNNKPQVNGSKTFEDLFGKGNQQVKGSRAVSSEPKAGKGPQRKVEYLFPEQKTAESSIPVPPALPADYLPPEPKLKAKQEQPIKRAPVKDEQKKGSSVARVAGNILTIFLLIMLFTVSFFLIQSRINEGAPSIAGYKMFVVLSGSMSPAFDTGSVVFVRETDPLNIVQGDIITFSSAADSDNLTTHRVIGINRQNGLSFVTKGDANNVNDPSPVPAENLVGRVTGSIPYIGYVFGFAQTRQGLILLIFIPGLLILLFEFRRIFSYLVDARVEQMRTDTGPASPPVPPAGNDGPGSSQGEISFSGRSYGRHG